MSNLDNALRELRSRRSGMQVELEKLDQIIMGIESLNGGGESRQSMPKRTVSASARRKMARAQRARWASIRKNSQPAGKTGTAPVKHTMSASARRKIAAAQRARWAKLKGQVASPSVAKKASPAPAKRKISAAGRRRIAAAQRARWAKIKAGKR